MSELNQDAIIRAEEERFFALNEAVYNQWQKSLKIAEQIMAKRPNQPKAQALLSEMRAMKDQPVLFPIPDKSDLAQALTTINESMRRVRDRANRFADLHDDLFIELLNQ
jgi:uncharacterized protein HemX